MPGWLSEDQVDRDIASTLCIGCEVTKACDDLARAIPATAGVWAGVDRTRTPKKSKVSPLMINNTWLFDTARPEDMPNLLNLAWVAIRA
jgi:Transcription factor WhiB